MGGFLGRLCKEDPIVADDPHRVAVKSCKPGDDCVPKLGFELVENAVGKNDV